MHAAHLFVLQLGLYANSAHIDPSLAEQSCDLLYRTSNAVPTGQYWPAAAVGCFWPAKGLQLLEVFVSYNV